MSSGAPATAGGHVAFPPISGCPPVGAGLAWVGLVRQPDNPLPWVAAAFILGLCAAPGIATGAGPWEWRVWAVLAVFCGSSAGVVWASLKPPGALGVDPGDGRRWQVALLAVGALVVGVVAPSQASTHGRAPVPPSGVARLEVVVEDSRPLGGGDTRSVVRVLRGTRLEDGAALAAGMYLSAGPLALPRAARVRLLARLAPRVRFRNPTPHPGIPPRYETRGHAWISDVEAISVLERTPWVEWLEAARQRVRTGLDATLPARAAGLARALVLGDDRAVDPDDAAQVRDAGLLHVLTVSGLHVAILAGLLVGLLERALLCCSRLAGRVEVRRIACAIGVPLVLGYAAFAGGAPSAWRAAVTAAIAWALIGLGRRPDPVAVTAAAALVLGVQAPGEVVRPAFLLSIGATAAILGGRFPRAGDLRSWLRDAFALSIRTTLATAPIVLWCFGTLPLAGVLANVLLAPFGSWLLVQLSALHALACIALTPLSGVTGALFVVVSDAFMTACEAFAELGPKPEFPPFDVAQGVVLAASAALLLLLRAARARAAIIALAACLLCAFELGLRSRERPRDELRVTFLDVGQGDAALVDLPDGRLMVIDAGGNPGGGPDPGGAVLLPLLQARRRARIDIAVVTHPHPDHYGGLGALIDALPITELWDSGQGEAERESSSTSAEFSRLLERARARGTRVLGPTALCGIRTPAATARISVLGPCPAHDPGLEPNDNSLVVRIDFGAHRWLFAGDAEAAAEHELLGQPEALHASVLKVGHHGSRTSTGERFLSAVAPRLAIISAGAGNRFGHPHPEVVERLQRGSIRVLSLAEVGGTIVRSDGRRLQVSTWRGDRFDLVDAPQASARNSVRR
jgi:competence protein ComEC